MVRIIDFKERVSSEGKPFMALVLQGGVEIVESSSGKMYATARKTSVVSTFDEPTCKMLIGQEFPGSIEKIFCDPYEYTHPTTGEVFILNHRYEYVPEMAKEENEYSFANLQTA